MPVDTWAEDMLDRESTVTANIGEYGVFNGHIDVHPKVDVRAIMPSSCNPLHAGHVNLLTTASRLLKCPVHIELCVNNADKPSLDYISIHDRCNQVESLMCNSKDNAFQDSGSFAGLVLSNQSKFVDKAALYPGAVFVVGMDTWLRIANIAYYPGGQPQAMESIWAIRKGGNRFLVFHRKNIGEIDADPAVLNELSRISTIVPDADYQDGGISSSQIRAENAKYR
jgi:hypothetical protein